MLSKLMDEGTVAAASAIPSSSLEHFDDLASYIADRYKIGGDHSQFEARAQRMRRRRQRPLWPLTLAVDPLKHFQVSIANARALSSPSSLSVTRCEPQYMLWLVDAGRQLEPQSRLMTWISEDTNTPCKDIVLPPLEHSRSEAVLYKWLESTWTDIATHVIAAAALYHRHRDLRIGLGWLFTCRLMADNDYDHKSLRKTFKVIVQPSYALPPRPPASTTWTRQNTLSAVAASSSSTESDVWVMPLVHAGPSADTIIALVESGASDVTTQHIATHVTAYSDTIDKITCGIRNGAHPIGMITISCRGVAIHNIPVMPCTSAVLSLLQRVHQK